MALDPSDLASLSAAIQNAITQGFSSAFPQRGGPSVPPAPPAPPGVPPTPPSPSPSPSPSPNPSPAEVRSTSVDASRTLLDSMAAAPGKILKGVEAGLEGLLEIQDKAAIQNYRDLVRNYSGEIKKITSEQFLERDFSKIINEGDRTVIESYRNLQEQADQFFEYEGLEFKKVVELKAELLQNFGESSLNLFNQNTKELENESLRFSNSIGVTIESVSELIANSFAQTGEASSDVLMEITNNAKAMGKAVGMPLKRMAEAIIDIKKDMETFTDITTESAARMAGSLAQLGLSLQSFKGLVAGYRSFDQAADKMGEISAVFGVQMDTMEMMYLANENEEEFLNRFREQVLDQGIDVASMSKTRQRALAEQLGMSIKEMKMFMDTGTRMTSQAEKEMATGEAASQTSADAVDTLNEGMTKVVRTTEEMASHVQNIQGMFAGISASKMLESFASAEGSATRLASSTSGIAKSITEMQTGIATLGEQGGKVLEGLVNKLLPNAGEMGVNTSWTSFGAEFNAAAGAAMSTIKTATDAGVAAVGLTPSSWPDAFLPIANGLGADKDGNPNENMNLYTATIQQWGQTLSDEITAAIAKIETSFDFEGIKTKFQSAAQLGDLNINAPDLSGAAASRPASGARPVAAASSETSALNKELLKSIDKITTKVESMPTEVNVKVDVEAMKADIVKAINEGFGSANYGFNLTLDGASILTSLSVTKDKVGRTIQFVG